MKQKKMQTFFIRLMFIFFVHLIFKIGDYSLNFFSEITFRGVIFTFFFVSYWLCIWYISAFLNKKIQQRQESSIENNKLFVFFLFTFNFIFGFFASFLANHLYRVGDITFFGMADTWAIVPIFNSEFILALTIFYMMVFTFDLYYNTSIKAKDDQLQMEKLKQENTLAQYLNLKSQIEPHFLFNSLSVLSSVIHTDVNLASEFTLRLSRMLRYVIEKNEFLLVPLSEEISFVENYLFLIQTRFEKGIIFSNTIDNNIINTCFVPPSSLQLLIENAVKHNKFTDNSPLRIKLYYEDGSLIVRNNIYIRNDTKNSTNMGLDNLTSRYSHFSEEPVVIDSSDNYFTVSLPILTNENYERTNI